MCSDVNVKGESEVPRNDKTTHGGGDDITVGFPTQGFLNDWTLFIVVQCFPITDQVSFPRASFFCSKVVHEKTYQYRHNSNKEYYSQDHASFPRV